MKASVLDGDGFGVLGGTSTGGLFEVLFRALKEAVTACDGVGFGCALGFCGLFCPWIGFFCLFFSTLFCPFFSTLFRPFFLCALAVVGLLFCACVGGEVLLFVEGAAGTR